MNNEKLITKLLTIVKCHQRVVRNFIKACIIHLDKSEINLVLSIMDWESDKIFYLGDIISIKILDNSALVSFEYKNQFNSDIYDINQITNHSWESIKEIVDFLIETINVLPVEQSKKANILDLFSDIILLEINEKN